MYNHLNESLVDMIEHTLVLPDSEIYTYSIQGKEIQIWETYRIASDFPLISKPWGLWNPLAGFISTSIAKWQRRQDMTGVHLIATANANAPVTLTRFKTNGEIEIDGYIGDLWKPLQEKLNFTTTFLPSIDGKWGSIEADGKTWNGMIGMVLNNEADIIVSDLALTEKRAQFVDFTVPIKTEM